MIQSLTKIIAVHSLAIRFEPNAREWFTIGCCVLSPWRRGAGKGALQIVVMAARGNERVKLLIIIITLCVSPCTVKLCLSCVCV